MSEINPEYRKLEFDDAHLEFGGHPLKDVAAGAEVITYDASVSRWTKFLELIGSGAMRGRAPGYAPFVVINYPFFLPREEE